MWLPQADSSWHYSNKSRSNAQYMQVYNRHRSILDWVMLMHTEVSLVFLWNTSGWFLWNTSRWYCTTWFGSILLDRRCRSEYNNGVYGDLELQQLYHNVQQPYHNLMTR